MTNRNPFISFIIPVYNVEKYLDKCLSSILLQTFSDYEVICIDDGSSDNSKIILEKYAKRYPKKFKLIFQNNFGPAIARNNGIKIAKGDYLSFIDSDDYIEKDYLQTLAFKADETDADIVIGGYNVMDNNHKLIKKVLPPPSFLKYSNTYVWGKIYKRSFIIENEIYFPVSDPEDTCFNLLAYSFGPRISHLKETNYTYVIRKSSLTRIKNFDIERLKEAPSFALSLPSSDPSMEEYFIIRYSIGGLLYYGKYSSAETFIKNTNHFLAWLNQNFSFDNKYLRKKPRGELFYKYFATILIIYLYKHNLLSKFAKIYCRQN